MKKIILSILIVSTTGCFNEVTVETNTKLKEFDQDKNLIRIDGKSIAGSHKIIDTGITLSETAGNKLLWIEDTLLLAGDDLKSVTLPNYEIKTEINASIRSICLDEEEIKIGESHNQSNLKNILLEKKYELNGLGFKEHTFVDKKQLKKNEIYNEACGEKYTLLKNDKLEDEKTELVSYAQSAYPFIDIKVYHDNSPKEKEGLFFKEKDFPRTRILYLTENSSGDIEEKLYKMNTDIDYKINTNDFENFSVIEGDIRVKSITTAIRVVDQIKILDFYRSKEKLIPLDLEIIDVSNEMDRLLKNVKITKINAIREGYLLTVENENGMNWLLKYSHEKPMEYLIKGKGLVKNMRVSEDLCKVALSQTFNEKESKETVKIINLCN